MAAIFDFFSEFFEETLLAVLIYVAGFLTSRFWQEITKRSSEERLKKSIRIAVDCIFEAERVIRGRKKGAERLEYATAKLMERGKIRHYQEAHQIII